MHRDTDTHRKIKANQRFITSAGDEAVANVERKQSSSSVEVVEESGGKKKQTSTG